jgi:type II secretory ATPase GspE/PulE/Tfp pilus assembly ATPase PilB-like protein
MKLEDKDILQVLLEESYITEKDVAAATEFAKANKASPLEFLLRENLITQDIIGQALAESFNVAYADLRSVPPNYELVHMLPESIAKKFKAVVYRVDDKKIYIASDEPENPKLKQALRENFPDQKLYLAYSLADGIEACFVHYQKPLETRFSQIIKSKARVAPELLDEIFNDALIYHASDIHFEPQPKIVLVRFRVDGILHEAGRIAKEYYENILNRIKVKSGLRIDEHFSAQDGSLRYEKDDTVVDMRTSIVPTVEGEKVVLRVLSAYVKGFSLNDLGLSSAHQVLFEEAVAKPFGMILVVGPTGSGKTTTLYALMKLVNSADVNITTIENPVEYKMMGINQIQVNAQTNLTFAKGLRSIVRQDPDIILVGEIRDEETAEIAVNAALTGHLLYSTFHANDAATAIPRLLNMGIEPFLLSSTLQIIVAQRLVRKICEHCRHSIKMKQSDFNTPMLKAAAHYFKGRSATLYQGSGCQSCGQTGYKGRSAIFEFIKMSPDMQNLILKSPSTKEIWQQARAEGSKSLFEDGVEKVKTGVTTLEELLRVAEPPQF